MYVLNLYIIICTTICIYIRQYIRVANVACPLTYYTTINTCITYTNMACPLAPRVALAPLWGTCLRRCVGRGVGKKHSRLTHSLTLQLHPGPHTLRASESEWEWVNWQWADSAAFVLRSKASKHINFLASLSKAAEKLRLSQAQAKKLVKKLRLRFSPMSP